MGEEELWRAWRENGREFRNLRYAEERRENQGGGGVGDMVEVDA